MNIYYLQHSSPQGKKQGTYSVMILMLCKLACEINSNWREILNTKQACHLVNKVPLNLNSTVVYLQIHHFQSESNKVRKLKNFSRDLDFTWNQLHQVFSKIDHSFKIFHGTFWKFSDHCGMQSLVIVKSVYDRDNLTNHY